MICTKCGGLLPKRGYRRTKKGPHHHMCSQNRVTLAEESLARERRMVAVLVDDTIKLGKEARK